MALVIDSGPLIALVDSGDEHHASVRSFLTSSRETLFLSPFALAEADYFVGRRVGVASELRMLLDVASGRLALEQLSSSDMRVCANIITRYRDLGIGLTDASLVLLAERHDTRRIVTFDERHFRALRTSKGEPFVILPADEPPSRRPRRTR